MARLGTKERPAILRVQDPERAQEILALCQDHGWQVIIGVESDQPDDLTDLDRLLHPSEPARDTAAWTE